MSGKLPRSALKGLADAIRQNPTALPNLSFADSTTCVTAIKTTDLRLDVHKNTDDPRMATGIIQANSGAKDKGVKSFIKGKTGGHKGTHQVIGQKIRFDLGTSFNLDQVLAAVENPYDDAGQGSSSRRELQGSSSASGSGTGSSSSDQWTWVAADGIWHRKVNGIDEWMAPTTSKDSDWIYSPSQRKYFIKHANGAVQWQ